MPIISQDTALALLCFRVRRTRECSSLSHCIEYFAGKAALTRGHLEFGLSSGSPPFTCVVFDCHLLPPFRFSHRFDFNFARGFGQRIRG